MEFSSCKKQVVLLCLFFSFSLKAGALFSVLKYIQDSWRAKPLVRRSVEIKFVLPRQEDECNEFLAILKGSLEGESVEKEPNKLCKKMNLSEVLTGCVEQEMRKLMLQSKKLSSPPSFFVEEIDGSDIGSEERYVLIVPLLENNYYSVLVEENGSISDEE